MTGEGQHRVLATLVPWGVLYTLPGDATVDLTYTAVATDWFFGGYPPEPTQIPYGWLTPPVRARPDKPTNDATVQRTGGGSSRAADQDSQNEYGVKTASGTLELDTVLAADPPSLAAYIIALYATQPGEVPRMRCPQLKINLCQDGLTTENRQTILALGRGQRISITDTPATWPAGLSELVVEGVAHSIAVDERTVTWNTSPVIGTTPGTAGPWFRLDDSVIDGTDILPF